jgi:hypothetical protein
VKSNTVDWVIPTEINIQDPDSRIALRKPITG